MVKNSFKKHAKVKQKPKDLKKSQKTLSTDLVADEEFVGIPASLSIPEEVEAELAEFRSNRVKFASTVKENLKDTSALDPEIREAYSSMAKMLKNYRSGPLPKAFKVIPNLEHWEKIVQLTQPNQWSPQTMSEAVKIFSSNMTPKQATIFYYNCLFPAVRENIQKHKKLNFHYYVALKKAFFKPAAWFKGVLFPICEDCTLKEASVVGSVIAKASVPALHAAAAIIKLCDMEYSGSQSHFIKILLDKGYVLPLKVLQALVGHFMAGEHDDRRMPVLWHQCLLSFVQRYASALPPEVKEQFKSLLRAQNHHEITPEIRKHLQNS